MGAVAVKRKRKKELKGAYLERRKYATLYFSSTNAPHRQGAGRIFCKERKKSPPLNP